MQETEVHFQSKGQRGKKVCNGCGKSVGVRTSKCECGFDFKNKVPVIEIETVNKVEVKPGLPLPPQEKNAYFTRPFTGNKNNNDRIILIPNGMAPFPLEDFSESGIAAWGRKVIQRIYETNRVYGLLSVDGLIHWTTYCYNSSSPQNQEKRNLIKKTLYNLAFELNNENTPTSFI